jgi:general stress protein 26
MVDLEWTAIVRRLAAAKIFWLHTTGPTGAPAAAPVWGATVEGVLYFYSERSTVKARNLERDPRVVIHLESGAEVLIVHGRLVDQGRPKDHRVVVEAFDQKYWEPAEKPFLPSSDLEFDVLYSLEPHRALMWSLPDTEASTLRWRSPQGNETAAP